MDEFITTVFGRGRNLDILQMSCRAFVLFFVTLALIKIAGVRTFGTRSAFDNVIVIMLGAIISRAVVGVSPFFPTLAASLVLCVIHRVLGQVSVRFNTVSRLVKGQEKVLYKNGQFYKKNMERCHITMGDLMGQLRLKGNTTNLKNVREIIFERSGEISIVKE